MVHEWRDGVQPPAGPALKKVSYSQSTNNAYNQVAARGLNRRARARLYGARCTAARMAGDGYGNIVLFN